MTARALPVFAYHGKTPTTYAEAMVSPFALVIGDVDIAEGATVFPGAVIRGDVAPIRIGRYTNIQEQVVLHGGDQYYGNVAPRGYIPIDVGDYVTVAHGSVIHGSTIEDVSMIGVHATLYDGSTIGAGSIVGMNAAVLANTVIPPRSIVVGVPAKVVRSVGDGVYSRLKAHAIWYHKLAVSHKGTLFLGAVRGVAEEPLLALRSVPSGGGCASQMRADRAVWSSADGDGGELHGFAIEEKQPSR